MQRSVTKFLSPGCLGGSELVQVKHTYIILIMLANILFPENIFLEMQLFRVFLILRSIEYFIKNVNFQYMHSIERRPKY